MATYSTSFVVNAGDLAKILEQIKIAERNAAGEALIDIIGKDSALLPMGLRTVDGSYNHLLPGQELVGAADQVFPRLIAAEYINEIDGDQMSFGPGAPILTNTNYDPTIPGSHSVVDADPRTISNLIVDQTINNKAAVLAALALTGITGSAAETAYNEIIAGANSTGNTVDPVAVAAAQAALTSALAAQALAATVNSLYNAYALAALESEQARLAATVAQNVASALQTTFVVGQQATTQNVLDLDTAIARATTALTEAQQLLSALTPAGPDLVASADVTAAQNLVNATTSLITALNLLKNGSNPGGGNGANGIDVGFNIVAQDITRLNDAVSQANAAVAAADTADNAVDAGAASFESIRTQAAASLASANDAVTTAQHNLDAANAGTSGPTLQELFNTYGLSVSADDSISIEHRSADIGLSPANSGWMTLFGQFFDHGLDLVTKGGNGTVYIPLQPDDPLIAGADHIFNTADDLPENLRFMTLTRATPIAGPGADGILVDDPLTAVNEAADNKVESQNTTTPFVDQNQTYTSSASHQVFLREYKASTPGLVPHAVNTGRLLNGENGGIANWSEVKAQAQQLLGLKLDDFDVNDVPLLEVDSYGKFKAGPNGFAQVHLQVQVKDLATGQIVGTLPNSEFLAEGVAGGLNIHAIAVPSNLGIGTPPAGMQYVVTPVGTGHAFLNDIAHHAAPGFVDLDHNGSKETKQVADGDIDANHNGIFDAGDTLTDVNGDGVISTADFYAADTSEATYDDEMLGSHFVTGDGRGNENIGLTAVHTIFHSEHNRLVDANKATILATGDLAFINEWLATDIGAIPSTPEQIAALNWDGERLFQAARFVTEMQYQHLVFEEFARRIQPNVDPFVFTNSADLDPAIVAEFAHAVYRFGHSQLTDTVDRLNNDLDLVPGTSEQVGLIEAFLNPQMFTASGVDDEAAAGAIIRGMSRQVGNEIDEFVVEALRNNLLGLPLDLAALNLARGREQGVATLNHAREQIYAMTGAADVKPYTSWLDLAQHLKHPLSVVNFIAAYGTHETITGATTLEDKRAAALALVTGVGFTGDAQERLDFLNSTNGVTAENSGLNAIDLWIGGLAEEHNEFGGQLGTTFNYIFEYQMEHLQNGDRMYYLSRTQGMNLLNLLEPNNFSDMIMRNTDLGDLHATHLPALIMSVPDMILELDKEVAQEDYSGADTTAPGYNPNPANRSVLDPTHDDSFQQLIDPKVLRIEGTIRMEGGSPVLDTGGSVIRDGGVLKFSGGEHVVLGGTEGKDTLIGDKGIDTLWGDGGNDYLNAGMESDQVYGGTGDDIIEDPFGDDFLRGEAGDDVIVADQGIDLLFGGEGQDFIQGVTDTKEVFAGPGDDFVLGGTAPDVLMGNEGDDWIEGGEGFDGLSGENSELFFNSPIVGHDILWGQGNDTDYDGENGDDIMVQGAGIQRNNGMEGFDWAIHKGDTEAANSDLSNFLGAGAVTPAFILRDRFDSVEGLSGWKFDDTLSGATKLIVAGGGFNSQITQAGVDRIEGLKYIIGKAADGVDPTLTGNAADAVVLTDIHAGDGGEIILGGKGSDIIAGNLGNDILDGDAWLNIRISVHAQKVPVGVNNDKIGTDNPEIFTVNSLTELVSGTGNQLWDGHSVAELMRTGVINPGQLKAVREILNSDGSKVSADSVFSDAGIHSTNSDTDIDTAVFRDVKANYTIEGASALVGGADVNGDGFITVTHTPPVAGGGGGGRLADGIDNIRNFEVLHFADGNVFLKAGLLNSTATGKLAVDITNDLTLPGLNVGDTVTANLGNVADLDGLPAISAFTFNWQFEQTPGLENWANLGETGRTLTITPLLGVDGNRLRVTASFVDAHGILESVVSDPTDTVAAQVTAAATAGADLLVGTNGPDLINALAGDDDVRALAGNDIVIGGPGSDALDGGLDADTAVFFGPQAQFTFALNALGQLEVTDTVTGDVDVVVNFETLAFINATVPISDAQVATLVSGGTVAGATLVTQSVSTLLDGVFINDPAGNASTLTGTEFDDVIFGNNGDDIIDGLGGSDLLVGGAGDDTIDSGGGLADIVSGGSGTNTIRLRADNETLLVGLGETGSDTVRNDGGIETISVGAVAVVNVPTQTGSAVAQLGAITTLTGLDDGAGNLVLTINGKTVTITDHFNSVNNAVELINFNGSSLDGLNLGTGTYNLVAAAAGAPILFGGSGNDALFGTAAADTLNGNNGNDLLLGGAGRDTLNGGAGNDILIGGTGADLMTGGDGDDTYVVNDVTGIAANRDQIVETATGGTDTVTGAVNLDLANYANVENITLTGTGNFSATGNVGNNVLTGNSGNNTLNGGGGDDIIVYNVAGGRDIVIGGANATAAGDRFVLNGSAAAETFTVFTRAAWDEIAGNNINNLAANTEIVVTRNGTNAASIVAELDDVEEITINTFGVTTPGGAGGGASGGDTINVVGNFTGTSLNFNTITINGSGDNDTVDVTGLTSAHHVVLNSGGGSDRFLGQRAQDEFNASVNTTTPGGATGGSSGGGTAGGNTSSLFDLTAADLQALMNIVRPTSGGGESEGVVGVRTLSGEGNNLAHPEFGSADTPFIRLTDAHYGSYDPATNNMSLNPIFDGLDARAISNVLSTQEADVGKNANGGNIFFMAFGQYFDHGLDFLPKGGNGKIVIGGVDVPGPPSSSNPVDLTRGSVVAGTENGIPQHINKTSIFVDQNQAYGSTSLVGQLLREGDGQGGLGAHLLAGGADPTAPDFKLLPTLRELIQHHWNNNTAFHDASLPSGQVAFRDYFAGLVGTDGSINAAMVTSLAGDFMGSGHALLLDTNPFINLLDHYVAGDGRANENVSLTAIHTIWARNHNFHVENLLAEGFTGTTEELFQAAKVINEVEYQRVVFTEFADTLIGGMKGSGSHGHDKYNPDANPGISEEFAAAVYRVGHSLISDKLTVIGADGQSKQISLVDAFLNPTNDATALSPSLPPGYVPQPGYEQLGANSIIAGIATQQAEEVDFNIVDAVRNDLVRIGADLAAFNIARGRDVGLGTLNQVRADLKASSDPYVHEAVGFAGNLDPYASWEDFQAWNGLSNAVINQFKQAYPDLVLDTPAKLAAFQAANPDIQLVNGNTVKGIDRVDLWVGGLAEKHINDGMVGQTFWVVLHEQFDRLQEADRFYYTDRVDNVDFYQNIVEEQTFSDIVARNTGLTGLQEHIFEVSSDGQSGGGGGTTGGGDTTGGGTTGGGATGGGTTGGGTTGGGGTVPDGVVYLFQGTPGNDSLIGSIYDDVLKGEGGNDDLFAFAGNDNLLGGDGDDRLVAGDGDDILSGGAGDDDMLAGAGNDIILAGDGNDRVMGGDGDDQIWGHKGRDVINGGAGNDVVYISAGDGDDVMHGDEGIDTLDFEAISADLTINLGANGTGSATSTESGHDVISDFENVKGGGGNDTIYASNSANVFNGGGGDDTFVFNTAATANGDRIEGFEAGDKIDLRPLFIGLGIADGHFTQIADTATFNAAGQIKIIVNGDDTTLQGNTDTDADIDFSIVIAGHVLRSQDLA